VLAAGIVIRGGLRRHVNIITLMGVVALVNSQSTTYT